MNSLASTNTKIIIWANCQGGPVAKMLEALHPNTFDIHWYSNFEFMASKRELPQCFKEAELFLYQNYKPKGDSIYDLDQIAQNILPNNCKKISFPTLHSNTLQFCYEFQEPKNKKTISKYFPHGYFKYGIKIISDLFQEISNKNQNIDEKIMASEKTISMAMSDEFIPNSDIQLHRERSLDFVRTKALSSSTPDIYEFIESDYTKRRLWHNPFHPNGILLDELCREIFSKIELEYKPSENDLTMLDNTLKDWVVPILPCVQKKYGMKLESKCESIYHPEIVSTESYIRAYLEKLYF